MRVKGKRTRHPGVYKVTDKTYRIRATARDPRTGRRRQVERVLDDVTAAEAANQRSEWQAQLRVGGAGATPDQVRVSDFAKSWIASKGRQVDRGTADRYVDALENHILPALCDLYFDAVTPTDVQRWVNDAQTKINPRTKTRYGAATVLGWWRVLRTMVRDAVAQLELPRDATQRINLPEAEEREGNSLTPEKLQQFLAIMRQRYPQHFALAVTLALTGLRFCHASALRWEDIDEAGGIIRIARKQVRGRVGQVSRKKRAPKEFPLEPALAAVLKEHRQMLLATQAPGLTDGWIFPSETGTLRAPSSLSKAWAKCLQAANIEQRFTPHGMRRSFNDHLRRAGVDPVTAKSLTGHVTEGMREHYSTVRLDEKRAAVVAVAGLLPRVGNSNG